MTASVRCRAMLTAVCALMLSCTNSTEPSSSTAAASLEAITPATIVAIVGEEVKPGPAVRVKDGSGNPVAGVAVYFTAAAGNGVVTNATAISNSNGVATATWILGTRVGTNSVSAASPGLTPVVISVTGRAGPLASMTRIAGHLQLARPGAQLARPLSVRAVDGFGNVVGGASVTFTTTAGDGHIAGAVAISDSLGIATSGVWTLGSTAGVQHAVASSGNIEVVFEAKAAPDACVSACARLIAFERAGRVLTVNEDGSGVHDLGEGRSPSWAPFGAKLLLERGMKLWILDLDQGAATQLTSAPWALDFDPAWSPDGSTVAFHRFWVGPDQSYLVVIDANGHGDRVLSMWWPVGGRITWSPDGGRIAFSCEGPPPYWQSDICIVPSGGAGGYLYNSQSNQGLVSVTTGTWIDSDPVWSSDGNRIAFTTDRPTIGGPRRIAVMSPDGTNIRTLAPGHHPAWSRDGTRIVFAGNADTPGLHVMNADGTGIHRITDDPNDTAPAWQP